MTDRILEESRKNLQQKVANALLNSELENMFQHDVLPPVKRSAKQIFFQLKNKLKNNDSYQYGMRLNKTALGVNLADLENRISTTRYKF
jgi:Nup93/Nic96